MTDLPHILNWRRQSDLITLSGQPSEEELGEIQASGVTQIINLGPHDNKGALDDEPGSVTALGMGYIYIPVEFDAPTDADYQAFCAALDATKDEKTHVHCIYNARVSAFFYRFAKDGKGGDPAKAFALMDGIWRPGGVWADFIGKPEDTDKPNRYLGEDYEAG